MPFNSPCQLAIAFLLHWGSAHMSNVNLVNTKSVCKAPSEIERNRPPPRCCSKLPSTGEGSYGLQQPLRHSSCEHSTAHQTSLGPEPGLPQLLIFGLTPWRPYFKHTWEVVHLHSRDLPRKQCPASDFQYFLALLNDSKDMLHLSSVFEGRTLFVQFLRGCWSLSNTRNFLVCFHIQVTTSSSNPWKFLAEETVTCKMKCRTFTFWFYFFTSLSEKPSWQSIYLHCTDAQAPVDYKLTESCRPFVTVPSMHH